MIVGHLRPGSTYRAKARAYRNGPVGQIEYYLAAPGARFYPGWHVWAPKNFFKQDVNTGVGELTEEGPRDFHKYRPIPVPCPGLDYHGSPEEFAGECYDPGATPPELLPDCEHPVHTTAPAPDRDPDWLLVSVSGLVVSWEDEEFAIDGELLELYFPSPGDYFGNGFYGDNPIDAQLIEGLTHPRPFGGPPPLLGWDALVTGRLGTNFFRLRFSTTGDIHFPQTSLVAIEVLVSSLSAIFDDPLSAATIVSEGTLRIVPGWD